VELNARKWKLLDAGVTETQESVLGRRPEFYEIIRRRKRET
jgi:hypothetical protein